MSYSAMKKQRINRPVYESTPPGALTGVRLFINKPKGYGKY